MHGAWARGDTLRRVARHSTDDLLRELERTGQLVIPASRANLLITLALSLVVGAGLSVLAGWIVYGTLREPDASPALFLINLRVWAIVIGAAACLLVAPWVVARRWRRREVLVMTPSGLAEHHRGDAVPFATLCWHEIREVLFERAAGTYAPSPRLVTYRLAPEAARRRGITTPGLLVSVWTGYELSRRDLYRLLRAAHQRYRVLS